jgi:hypothetical protein
MVPHFPAAMKKALLLMGLLVLFVFSAACQSAPPSGMEDEELRAWLRANWYAGKHQQMGYNKAREAMYSYVDVATDGRVYCVYTGFSQPSATTTYLNPINAEHTVPQSFFGEDEPMRSDIHHLFPTHELVNSSRGNLDFGEIDDNITDKWYVGGRIEDGVALTVLTSKPASNIDAYSELDGGSKFEVKEDHKGNAARAVFYFYTMYPTQGGSIEDLADLQTLYDWHVADPVDEAERVRNDRAASRQGNRNPYIDYPELAGRAWGFSDGNECLPPDGASSGPEASNVTETGATILWTAGNGEGRLVLLKEGTDFGAGEHPASGTAYSADAQWGQGSALGQAYAVYKGTGSAFAVSGLKAGTAYVGKVVEYACDPPQYRPDGATFSFSTRATGLEEAESAGMQLRPNPASGLAVLRMDRPEPTRYVLLNAQGQQVLEGTARLSETPIPLSGLAPGLYLVRLGRSQGAWISRLVVR